MCIRDSIRYGRTPKRAELYSRCVNWLDGYDKYFPELAVDEVSKDGILAVIQDSRGDPLSCLLARLHYLRVPEAVPATVQDMALYAKAHYNTRLGKATAADFRIVPDEESILSEMVHAGVDRLWLSWHYRSQDESLIAFSNGRYYDDRLSSFPAYPGQVTDTGLSFTRVDGTFYRSSARAERGSNGRASDGPAVAGARGPVRPNPVAAAAARPCRGGSTPRRAQRDGG